MTSANKNQKYKNQRYKICASILDCNFLKLGDEIKKVENLGIRMLHVDVMDGAFVPNFSFGQPIIKRIRDFTRLGLDIHLMIKNPEDRLDSFIQCGADILSVHADNASI